MANANTAWGTWGSGFQDAWDTGTQGLDPSRPTGSVTKGTWYDGSGGMWGSDKSSYQQTADMYNQTYTDPTTGDVYTRSNSSFGGQVPIFGGQWTDASGRLVNNLAGAIKNKQQVASGSDFSGYQAGLNSALNDQSNYGSRYKQLLDDPSKIQQTAGYQFALDQGNQAINRSAAAKGMLNSGNVLAELAKYGQGMASQEYGNQLNAIQQGAGMAGNQVKTMSGLMQNAQQFGLNTGYYPGQVQNQTNQLLNKSGVVSGRTTLGSSVSPSVTDAYVNQTMQNAWPDRFSVPDRFDSPNRFA